MGRSASLTNINLGRNKIGDDGARGLGAALMACSTLTSLDLSYCGDQIEDDTGMDNGLNNGHIASVTFAHEASSCPIQTSSLHLELGDHYLGSELIFLSTPFGHNTVCVHWAEFQHA